MPSQTDKAKQFLALHQSRAGFVMPNPWDRGSTRILETAGFKALATSSVAYANTLGRGDYALTRDEAIAHARDIVAATDLPVSADLENGFADRPEGVADCVAQAIEVGLAGCSIEDLSRDAATPIYPIELAVRRIEAAVAAARRSGSPFVITARTENFLAGRRDLDDTIRRLVAFEKAGADVVYATGLPSLAEVEAVVAAVKTPVNVMASKAFKVAELTHLGVRRISLGPWFARAAMAGFLEAMREVKEAGTFGFVQRCPSGGDILKAMG
jgi:2-methylisocitrate lyase-like PEP mutase family enzyme